MRNGERPAEEVVYYAVYTLDRRFYSRGLAYAGRSEYRWDAAVLNLLQRLELMRQDVREQNAVKTVLRLEVILGVEAYFVLDFHFSLLVLKRLHTSHCAGLAADQFFFRPVVDIRLLVIGLLVFRIKLCGSVDKLRAVLQNIYILTDPHGKHLPDFQRIYIALVDAGLGELEQIEERLQERRNAAVLLHILGGLAFVFLTAFLYHLRDEVDIWCVCGGHLLVHAFPCHTLQRLVESGKLAFQALLIVLSGCNRGFKLLLHRRLGVLHSLVQRLLVAEVLLRRVKLASEVVYCQRRFKRRTAHVFGALVQYIRKVLRLTLDSSGELDLIEPCVLIGFYGVLDEGFQQCRVFLYGVLNHSNALYAVLLQDLVRKGWDEGHKITVLQHLLLRVESNVVQKRGVYFGDSAAYLSVSGLYYLFGHLPFPPHFLVERPSGPLTLKYIRSIDSKPIAKQPLCTQKFTAKTIPTLMRRLVNTAKEEPGWRRKVCRRRRRSSILLGSCT